MADTGSFAAFLAKKKGDKDSDAKVRSAGVKMAAKRASQAAGKK